MARWVSYDKQDWSFRGPGFVGTAFLVADKAYDDSPAHVLVWGFSEKFSTDQFHQILWLTRAQFLGFQVWCEDRGAQGAQLDELVARGAIEIEHVGVGKVRVMRVEKPDAKGRSIYFFPERLWRRLVEGFGAATHSFIRVG